MGNTAHYYMECSNKGLCDRQSGTCQCIDGYSGSSCQRADCPDTGNGVCSGHGTCENIKTISAWDNGNIYKLWDEQATMGCVCDGGFTGANCEDKMCKYGADPLYQDSFQTIRFSNWTYEIYTTSSSAVVTGNYSLVFTDSFGEDWSTAPIAIDTANCTTVIAALEGIPNNVIPADTVQCHKWAAESVFNDATAFEPFEPSEHVQTVTMTTKYSLAFPANPGMLKDMQINTHLDGSRTTLFTDEATSTLSWYIYSNGFYGEDYDMVPDLCTGVLVNLGHGGITTDQYGTLTGLTAAELILLKKCLGDADGDATNNAETEVFNWDHGSKSNPHLIKLVDATQDDLSYTDTDPTHFVPNKQSQTYMCTGAGGSMGVDGNGFCNIANPPGFYAAIFWHSNSSTFRMFGRGYSDYTADTNFHVYTTGGTLQIVSATTQAFNTWNNTNSQSQAGNLFSNKMYTTDSSAGTRANLDCETKASGEECLEIGDHFMVLNTGYTWAADNAPATTQIAHESAAIYPQIYSVKKISIEPVPYDEWDTTDGRTTWAATATIPTFVRNQIVADKSFNINPHLDTVDALQDTSAAVYKFTPPTNQYNYAGACSLRGICDAGTGLCSCFNGFTNDNCDTIDALAA